MKLPFDDDFDRTSVNHLTESKESEFTVQLRFSFAQTRDVFISMWTPDT